MIFLLDTNTVIARLNGDQRVSDRLKELTSDDVVLCAPVLASGPGHRRPGRAGVVGPRPGGLDHPGYLHAKCVIADEERAFITSANFTEAARQRNIEAGVVIADTSLARALKAQFDTLVERRALRRIPGL